MEVTDMVQQAQDKEFTQFDASAKEILSQKVAAALDEKGYFDRLTQAQNESPAKKETNTEED